MIEYLSGVAVVAAIYVILAIGLDLVVGYTGIASLGQSAFALIGAYTAALISTRLGAGGWLDLLAAMAAGGVSAAAVGLPVLRLRGDYLALMTLGFVVLVSNAANNMTGVTGGALGIAGIRPFSIGAYEFVRTPPYAVLTASVAVCVYVLSRRLARSPFGRVLTSIRDDEVAAMALGKATWIFKMKVFVIAGCFSGLGGGIYAHYISYVDPQTFGLNESLALLLMVIFGGMGTVTGAALGASVLIALPESLRFLSMPPAISAHLRLLVYGVLLVLLTILRPQGMLGRLKWR
jgi:branched-chain amino acid transport system permease protein